MTKHTTNRITKKLLIDSAKESNIAQRELVDKYDTIHSQVADSEQANCSVPMAHSEQDLRVKLENIIEATVGWDQNLDWVKPETWNDCTNQIMQLIQSEREKVLEEYKKSRCIHGFCYCSPCVQCIAKLAQKEESK